MTSLRVVSKKRQSRVDDVRSAARSVRSSSSDHDSSRSPSRIAAAAPYCSASPGQPCSRCSASNALWVAGRPAAGVRGVHVVVVHQRARVQQLERRGRAHQAPASSGASAAHGPEAPVAEGRAEPLAAGRPPARAAATSRAASSPSGASRRGLLVDERVEGGLHAGAEGVRVPGSELTAASLRSARADDGQPPGGPVAPMLLRMALGHLLDLPGRTRSPRRRPDRRGGAVDLVRVLPAEGRGRRAAAVDRAARARAAAADLRLGDVRRRRLDPRPHRSGSPRASRARPR